MRILARRRFQLLLAMVMLAPATLFSQQANRTVPHAPDRGPNEGEGPFERLIIRGVIVVDGTGAPGQGPIDIVIEGNRII